MKHDPGQVIEKIAKFLNVPLSPDLKSKIVKETSFEVMKKNPATNYEHWDTYGLRVPEEAKFMRKGVVGDYKNHMNEETSAAMDRWIKWKLNAVEPLSCGVAQIKDHEFWLSDKVQASTPDPDGHCQQESSKTKVVSAQQ